MTNKTWEAAMFAVSTNPVVAATMLQRLADDVPKGLVGVACVDDVTLTAITGTGKVPVDLQAAAASVADEAGCRRLAADKRVAVQCALLRNTSCPDDTFATIAHRAVVDGSDQLFEALAPHPRFSALMESVPSLQVSAERRRFRELAAAMAGQLFASTAAELPVSEREAFTACVHAVAASLTPPAEADVMDPLARLVAIGAEYGLLSAEDVRNVVSCFDALFSSQVATARSLAWVTPDMFDAVLSSRGANPSDTVLTAYNSFSSVPASVVEHVVATRSPSVAVEQLLRFVPHSKVVDIMIPVMVEHAADDQLVAFACELRQAPFAAAPAVSCVDRFVSDLAAAGRLTAAVCEQLLTLHSVQSRSVEWSTVSTAALLETMLHATRARWFTGMSWLSAPSDDVLRATLVAHPHLVDRVVEVLEPRRLFSHRGPNIISTAADMSPTVFFAAASEALASSGELERQAALLDEHFGSDPVLCAEALNMFLLLAESWSSTTEALFATVVELASTPPESVYSA